MCPHCGLRREECEGGYPSLAKSGICQNWLCRWHGAARFLMILWVEHSVDTLDRGRPIKELYLEHSQSEHMKSITQCNLYATIILPAQG